jgi:hypothetical protein
VATGSIARLGCPIAEPAELRPIWTAEVGVGFASPVARSGRVFLFSFIDGHDTLTCYHADTGDVVWTDRDESGWAGLYTGSRATRWTHWWEGEAWPAACCAARRSRHLSKSARCKLRPRRRLRPCYCIVILRCSEGFNHERKGLPDFG